MFLPIDSTQQRPTVSGGLCGVTDICAATPLSSMLSRAINQGNTEFPFLSPAKILLNQQINDIGDRAARLQRAGVDLPYGQRISALILPTAEKLQQLTPSQRSTLLQIGMHAIDMPKTGEAISMLEHTSALVASGVKLPDLDAPHTLDVATYLSNRLSHGAVEFIKHHGVEFFEGGGQSSLLAHYAQKGFDTCHQITSSTSTRCFLMTAEGGSKALPPLMVMTGMASTARLRHQLLQLHYAGVDTAKIALVGTLESSRQHNTSLLDAQLAQLPTDIAKTLFIGVRWKAMESIGRVLHQAPADLVEQEAYRLMDATEWTAGNFYYDTAQIETSSGPHLFACLRMPNGDLAYDAARSFIAAGFTRIVMCGAGGHLGGRVNVGDFVRISSSEHAGQRFTLAGVDQPDLAAKPFLATETVSNLTVDSPLVETRAWLEACKTAQLGTVDVETAHIFKAIEQCADPITLIPGMFISDVIGQHPLEEKISADAAYLHLTAFVETALDSLGITSVQREFLE